MNGKQYLLLTEITNWDTPNHSYIVTENKEFLVGYIKRGDNTPQMFKKPMQFSIKHRKFIQKKL